MDSKDLRGRRRLFEEVLWGIPFTEADQVTFSFRAAKTYHEYSQLQLLTASSHSRLEYTALNLNCGYPSPAVSGKKRFGAALMKDPAHVTKLVRAIHDGIGGRLPVTVKCYF